MFLWILNTAGGFCSPLTGQSMAPALPLLLLLWVFVPTVVPEVFGPGDGTGNSALSPTFV